jgi:hypothetical protein
LATDCKVPVNTGRNRKEASSEFRDVKVLDRHVKAEYYDGVAAELREPTDVRKNLWQHPSRSVVSEGGRYQCFEAVTDIVQDYLLPV